MAGKERRGAAAPRRGKGGRPPHQPTPASRRLVESLAGFGVPQRDIARVAGISHETLAKHYPEQLARGIALANAKVAESLFRKATSPDAGPAGVTAAIFWAKVRMGWREPPQAIEQTVTWQGKRAEEMSDDELAAIASGGGPTPGKPPGDPGQLH